MMSESLKLLVQNLTSSKLSVRKSVFEGAIAALEQERALPDAAIKALCRHLSHCFLLYDDSSSRLLVHRLFATLVSINPEGTLRNAAGAFSRLVSQMRAREPNRGVSRASVMAVISICRIFSSLSADVSPAKEDLRPLLECLCALCIGCFTVEKVSLQQSVYRNLQRLWKKKPACLDQTCDYLRECEHRGSNLAIISFICRFLQETGQTAQRIGDLRGDFIKHFIDSSVIVKGKPSSTFLKCSGHLLRSCVNRDVFADVLLPAFQKALLRSPESSMEAVSVCLANLDLELSDYVPTLLPLLASHLKSNDELVSGPTSDALVALGRQCSRPEVVQEIVKRVHAILMGAEGKIALTENRQRVASTLGRLSTNGLVGREAVEPVVDLVACDLFPTYIKMETHDSTLICALAQLEKWTKKNKQKLPEKLLAFFKANAFAPKLSTGVRVAYLQCLQASCTRHEALAQLQPLTGPLLDLLQRAAKQPGQAALVAEAAHACALLVRAAPLLPPADAARLEPLWAFVSNKENKFLFNRKFLANAPDAVFPPLVTVVERMLAEYPDKLSDQMQGLMARALLVCLTHPNHAVRGVARANVRPLLHGLRGVELCLLLLAEFDAFLQAECATAVDNGAAREPGDIHVRPHLLCECLRSITALQPNNESLSDRVGVVLKALNAASHPAIVAHDRDAWFAVVRRLGLAGSARAVVESGLEELVQQFLSLDTISEISENALIALCRLAPEMLISQLQGGIISLLKASEFSEATAEEVGIMNTPEGELYDKSIIERSTKYQEQTTNIKRESKLYSYKEQMEELELKKELEAKKRNRGDAHVASKAAAPKLTKQQEEMLVAQRERETSIRQRMLPLNKRLHVLTRLLVALGRGDASVLRSHLPEIVPTLVHLLSSPLAATHAAHALVELRHVAFIPVRRLRLVHCSLAELAPHALVRLASSAACPDPAWAHEPLEEQSARLVGLVEAWQRRSGGGPLWTRAVEDGGNLSFALVFPALRLLVVGGEGVAPAALAALARQVALSGSAAAPEWSPELLPRRQLVEVLAGALSAPGGGHGSPMLAAAHAALLELARRCAAAHCLGADALRELLARARDGRAQVRSVLLKCLEEMAPVVAELAAEEEGLARSVSLRVFAARFDADEVNAATAARLWAELQLQHEAALIAALMPDLVHHHEAIRAAAAKALAALIEAYPDELPGTLEALFEKYKEKLHTAPPTVDAFGRVLVHAGADAWETRAGVAQALGRLAERLPEEQVYSLFQFLVPDGLNDRHEAVRQEMLSTAMALVELYGKSQIGVLLPLLENFLSTAPNVPELDAARQSVVVLIGSLAKHLDKDNPKVKTIFVKLLESLSFPSQAVQQSVANCLPPLMPALRDEAERVVQKLLALLLESDNYGERRGAAYGLAGVVKGLGILLLKQLDITERLTEAVQDKKNPKHREGALFAFESLCLTLGRVYEPYIVNILPHLLLAFGDSNAHVREAANDCAKAVMSKLSAHGVKLVLPSLLKAIEEDSWRTKSGSVELLGAMAFCAPKQLSACLPQIVPKLMEVLADSHLRVQHAGSQALRQIGSVIKNPEIQDIVPILMEALQEPLTKTTSCLQILLNTQFVHVIDAPSLALIMPVVQRGFKDRSTETRKMAAQIIGNMYSLTDHKDLQPYLDGMLPGLQTCLLDPVPEVRGMAARALGAMVRGMGESAFNDMLMPWLMRTLTSEASSVDRSGAAQGLAEVIGGLGASKLDSMMPHIMEMTENAGLQPHVRDGYLMLYIYLPLVYADGFSAYVGPILPSILRALADETEFVRETALRAGQRVVQMFAGKAIELLLPELERGMFDANWRIRHSSVQLLGDLLYRVSGVTGKGTTEGVDEDDTFGTEESHASIREVLGDARRGRVLSGLYMARFDTELTVRHAAVHVWKVIVANTPRTLREIMPVLFSLLLGCLAADSEDKRKVATGTLGDIVRKLGERVLSEILQVLEGGLEAAEAVQRQGVCVGLSEIIANTSREQMAVHADLLVPPVRRALCDPHPEVRAAAAATFDTLYAKVGRRALDEVLPSLLERLDAEGSEEAALDGLRQVVAVKSAVVLPYLIPKLTSPTVNTRAFSFLAEVAGDALSRHLGAILPALLDAVAAVMGTDAEAEELEHCTQVILSVADEQGLRTVLDEFTGANLHGRALDGQIASMLLLEAFVKHGQLDLADHFAPLLRAVLSLFVAADQRLLNAAWDCLNAIVQKWSSEESRLYVIDLRQAVQMAVREYREEEVPGFGLPKKGIMPFITVYREGIFNGQLDVKEAAARGLGEIVRRTSKPALQQAVVKVAGPLIRVMGDRYSHSIKASILETLGILLEKCPTPMRPFLTQLQTTFIKALNDQTREVRLRAAVALGHLMAISSKPDPVLAELVGLARAGDEARDTALFALRLCAAAAGGRLSEGARRQAAELLRSLLADEEDGTRVGAAAGLGALCASAPDAEPGLRPLLLAAPAGPASASGAAWLALHAQLSGLLVALRYAGDRFANPDACDEQPALRALVEEACDSDRLPLRLLGIRCLTYLIVNYVHLGLADLVRRSTQIVLSTMQNCPTVEARHLCARMCSFVAAECPDVAAVRLFAPGLLSGLLAGLKDRNAGVRAASEQAVVDVCDLHNKEDDNVLQVCLGALDGTARSTLGDTVARMRKRPLPKDVPPVVDNTELK